MISPTLRLCLPVVVVALAGTVALAADAGIPRPRSLILTGWDNPDTAQFARDLHSLEGLPFDGVVLYANGKGADGAAFNTQAAFGSNHWDEACLDQARADLKGVHSNRLTENFLIFGANPGSVDWFNDAGWREIQAHCRQLARVARQGGLRGLLFDPENYTDPFKQFDYSRQARHAEHSFADYCLKARQRGRETMEAIAGEFPDAVVLSYFLAGQCARRDNIRDVRPDLEAYWYGLLPAFLNGWLDRIPVTMTLVDGNESAYHYNSEAAFEAGFVRIKNACLGLIEPENRPKYRAQVQAGHGIYLDGYIYPPDSKWYLDPQGATRVKRLEENVTHALDTADRYVWIYGEHARWWPPAQAGAKAPPTWPEALAGIESALASARHPAGAAK